MFRRKNLEVIEVYKGKDQFTVSIRQEKIGLFGRRKTNVITIIGSPTNWRYFPSFFEVEPWMIDQFDAAFLRWKHKKNLDSALREEDDKT